MSIRDDQPVESTTRDNFGGEEREDKHPAFGVAVVSRGSGSGRSLFQSDLLHRETVSLTIYIADRKRSLHRDWVHPRKPLVEVEMSLAQWGALVSAAGIGSGVPVTLRYTETTPIVPGIPHEPRTAESLSETRGKIQEMLRDALVTLGDLEQAVESKAGIRATREALRAHALNLEHMSGNAEFAIKSLNEAAESVVSTARADIEAHILEATRLTGQAAPIESPDFTGAIDG